ncbi:MAG: hypothetical protein AABX03_04090 [Nanoarchaeota archaeon]
MLERPIHVERIKLAKVKTGVRFRAKPHFVAPYNAERYFSKSPGFYLEDARLKPFIGYLKKLNPDQINGVKNLRILNTEYDVIVREVRGLDKQRRTIVHLEEAVNVRDFIYLELERKSNSHDRLVGYFLSYKVLVPQEGLSVGNCIMGMVGSVNDENTRISLVPIERIEKDKYSILSNIIFRS